MKLGAVFGIPVFLHWSFALLCAAVFIQSGMSGMAGSIGLGIGLFGSVLLRELGHALAARAFGIQTRDITLYPFGGVAALERLPDDTRKELVIAIAGPAVNAVLFGLGVAAWWATGLETALVFSAINAVMGIFNLVPAFPMDGGRVLRALLAERMSFAGASAVAAGLGAVLGGLFVAVGLLSGSWSLALVGGFVWFAGRMEQRRLVQLLHLGWRPPRPGGYPEGPRYAYRPRWSVR